jgi:hypothetical protein
VKANVAIPSPGLDGPQEVAASTALTIDSESWREERALNTHVERRGTGRLLYLTDRQTEGIRSSCVE